MSDDETCEKVEIAVTMHLSYTQCKTHGHPVLSNVFLDPGGVDPETFVPDMLSVIENLIGMRYLFQEDGPLNALANAEYAGDTLDNDEKLRLGAIVGNQILMTAVRKRAYARRAMVFPAL